MPADPHYPGLYVQETPTSSRTVVAAPTTIAAFIGYTHPLKTDPKLFGAATQIFGFMDYQRLFGGFVRSAAFAKQSSVHADGQPVGDLASAISQFFRNGGSTCYVVALDAMASQSPAAMPPTVTIGGIVFTAREITDSRNTLSVTINPRPTAQPALADVVIRYGTAGGTATVETYRGLSLSPTIGSPAVNDPNYIETRIRIAANPTSSLVTVKVCDTAAFPSQTTTATMDTSLPDDTVFYDPAAFIAALAEGAPLDQTPILNLLSLPAVQDQNVLSAAIALCERKHAFLIIDPPILDSADGTAAGFPHMIQQSASPGAMARSKNAALYFPYLLSPDPVSGAAINPMTALPNEIPPGPSVAGAICANDSARGVWKAPAGMETMIINTTGVVARGAMNDARQAVLNPLSVNCLRNFPNAGTVIFGARTFCTAGDNQWQYVSVRRMALFLQQTFAANFGWVAFEPNDEPLWAMITASIQAFMLGLFKNGAFQGVKPSEAFYVKCDAQTTTQTDIDNGIVNIIVGFAPLKPAEFVVLTFAQPAGQVPARQSLRKIPPIMRR